MSRIADVLEKARKEQAERAGPPSKEREGELQLQTMEQVEVPWRLEPGPAPAPEPEPESESERESRLRRRESQPTRVEDRIKLSPDDAAIARQLFLEGSAHRRILLSAVDRGDGSDVLALGLALALGRDSKGSVCLVDLNLRGGTLHRLLQVDAAPGLAELIAERASAAACIRAVQSNTSLSLIPTGSDPRRLRLALREPAGKAALRDLLSTFDFVVAHATPGAVDDAAAVGDCFDGVLLVREADTQPQITNAAADALKRASVPLAGVVVNHAARPGSRNTPG